MTEPTTINGRILAATLRGFHPDAAPGWPEEGIAAIEAEAREGYVPAPLSPEWKAELAITGAEARADLARRIEARVRNECRYAAELELCPECAAVVLAIRDEAARP